MKRYLLTFVLLALGACRSCDETCPVTDGGLDAGPETDAGAPDASE
jgi:hypothetical protein